jgi:hypothetical protein
MGNPNFWMQSYRKKYSKWEKWTKNEDVEEEAGWALRLRVSISSNDATQQLLKGAREGLGGVVEAHNALK